MGNVYPTDADLHTRRAHIVPNIIYIIYIYSYRADSYFHVYAFAGHVRIAVIPILMRC